MPCIAMEDLTVVILVDRNLIKQQQSFKHISIKIQQQQQQQ